MSWPSADVCCDLVSCLSQISGPLASVLRLPVASVGSRPFSSLLRLKRLGGSRGQPLWHISRSQAFTVTLSPCEFRSLPLDANNLTCHDTVAPQLTLITKPRTKPRMSGRVPPHPALNAAMFREQHGGGQAQRFAGAAGIDKSQHMTIQLTSPMGKGSVGSLAQPAVNSTLQ